MPSKFCFGTSTFLFVLIEHISRLIQLRCFLFTTSISTVLQAQVFEDVDASPESKLDHTEFNHSPFLTTESESISDVVLDELLVREAENDDELRFKLQAGTVPTVESIFR